MMDRVTMGAMSNEICDTCRDGLQAVKIVLKGSRRGKSSDWRKTSCNTRARNFLVPEVCSGLLERYIDDVSDP